MNRNLIIAAAVPAVVALAAAYFAWSATGELEGVRRELNTTKVQADRSRTELLAVRQELAKVQKEFTELKISADQAMAERDSVRRVLETEQAAGVKLRQDLALAKEQISSLSARLAGGRR